MRYISPEIAKHINNVNLKQDEIVKEVMDNFVSRKESAVEIKGEIERIS